ncbi:hypothetical protein TVAG_475510 [Trichomonas vaginalis G3]|uniref:DUF3447 domain-containing protein n=1 Tax=Trichomonas vaginalis (strain ATCC PRA-98 / G3) TaxID=412133 RepID=A2D9X5_TRIV3|nr:protein ubiquitination [Trichomonas vaginalis G3]EAY22623.1 hypothetical protein TVAG_475510 [Trichomonas vaginalis G3]KAI5525437.1 protein ubiquitination [Trichomonas vaginalis G3]|eukprot:XP_001583609.1 hypothetical protein [Trichomonas vaginalis G3]
MSNNSCIPCSFSQFQDAINIIWSLNENNFDLVIKKTIEHLDNKVVNSIDVFNALISLYHVKIHLLQSIFNVISHISKIFEMKNLNLNIEDSPLKSMLIQANILESTNNDEYHTLRDFKMSIPSLNPINFSLINDDFLQFIKYTDDVSNYDSQLVNVQYEKNPYLSLLDAAAFYGSFKIFTYLFKPFRITKQTFCLACFGGNINIVRLLLEHKNKFSIDSNCIENAIINHHDNVADYLLSKFNLTYSWSSTLSTNNLYFFFKKLRESNNINEFDDNDENAILCCARYDNKNLMKYLISIGANIESVDKSKRTPLIVAADVGNYKIIKCLLKNGANINKKTASGSTALLRSCYSGNVNCCKILLEKGANTEIKNDYGMTPLLIACSHNYEDIIEMLLNYNACFVTVDNGGRNCLEICIKNNNLKCLQALLNHKANPNIANSNGLTPLQLAAKLGNSNIVKALLKSKANPYTKDPNGKTAREIADELGFDHIVHVLDHETKNICLVQKLRISSSFRNLYDFNNYFLSEIV